MNCSSGSEGPRVRLLFLERLTHELPSRTSIIKFKAVCPQKSCPWCWEMQGAWAENGLFQLCHGGLLEAEHIYMAGTENVTECHRIRWLEWQRGKVNVECQKMLWNVKECPKVLWVLVNVKLCPRTCTWSSNVRDHLLVLGNVADGWKCHS